MYRLLLTAIALLLLTGGGMAAPYAPPAQATDTLSADWRDARRNRTVPVKIYYPKGEGRFPVVLFSHGLGGSREGYGYLGSYWAGRGYVAVHLQHIGSDETMLRDVSRDNPGGNADRLRSGAAQRGITLQTVRDRPLDVSFAIDELQRLDKDKKWPLQGKLDFTRIGLGGHSFGANTTLLISGMRLGGGAIDFRDPRVKCAVVLSAPPPQGRDLDAIYGSIKIPLWHMTGTLDTSPIDPKGSRAIDRRIPYDRIKGTDGYLTTFTGGDHMVFSGRERNTGPLPTDARNHELIQQSTLAFWDAYLKGDTKALGWLRGEYGKELGKSGVFEFKRKNE